MYVMGLPPRTRSRAGTARRERRRGRRGAQNLDRDPPQGEPALELRFHRELAADLGLEPQLALVVAALVAAGRHERVVGAALVVVDPVHGMVGGVAEGEDRAQDPLPVAAVLERL